MNRTLVNRLTAERSTIELKTHIWVGMAVTIRLDALHRRTSCLWTNAHISGPPSRIRTEDPALKRRLLWAAELKREIGRGCRIRTHVSGFGDRHSAIESNP